MSETPNKPEDNSQRIKELGGDIKVSLCLALGAVAAAGVSAYATYETVAGRNPSWESAGIGSGIFAVSLPVAALSGRQAISSIIERHSLKKSPE